MGMDDDSLDRIMACLKTLSNGPDNTNHDAYDDHMMM